MKDKLFFWLTIPIRYHFFGSLGIVGFVAVILTFQVNDRHGFANSELYTDVTQRWGTPIVQPMPSVRYVASGTVFNALKSLSLDKQNIKVQASMNYRKRGLVYFSGFDFSFQGNYVVRNPESYEIDVAFVFPIKMHKNRTLLSDLRFLVDQQPAPIVLIDDNQALLWTGRVKPAEKRSFSIAFCGRGLDSFSYVLDPAHRVKDFHLSISVTGGETFDYRAGVMPAHKQTVEPNSLRLEWNFASLESGVPVGIILPSEKSFDQIIITMLRRSWAPFVFLFCAICGLGLYYEKRLKFYEAYLIAALYGLFHLLTAYLAAFLNFYGAYVIALVVVVLTLVFYLKAIIHRRAGRYAFGLLSCFLFIPSLAVILEGYTGLIYTIEIATGLIALAFFTTKSSFRVVFSNLLGPAPSGESHA